MEANNYDVLKEAKRYMDSATTLSSDAGQYLVLLGRMPQQQEVRIAEDDWTGSTSAQERRKRQNRLHQRLYRKRQRLQRLQKLGLDDTSKHGEFDVELNDLAFEKELLRTIGLPNGTFGPEHFVNPKLRPQLSNSNMSAIQVQDLIQKVEIYFSQERLTGSPRADLLLTLIQFNVFRALVSNTFTMGLELDWLQEDAVSPFNQGKISTERKLPPTLSPSKLQYAVNHHPWIDIWPFPAFRDNILRNGEDYDDEEDLCYDLVEICHTRGERNGLIVWGGQPWDPLSWEVEPRFIDKWSHLLRGCGELLESTNRWRRQRGEAEIFFDATPSSSSDG